MCEDPCLLSTMIHWIFSKTPLFNLQECLNNLEEFFSSDEIETLQGFTVPKRKLEWLNSRLIIKSLVADTILPKISLPLSAIEVQKMHTGVPFVVLNGTDRFGWLSLSHSQEGVFAAFSQNQEYRFGVDTEFLEERSPELISDFFTETESRWVDRFQGQERIYLANLIWSAKEAFLKAIEKGLQLDTRCVEITPCDLSPTVFDWNALEFKINGQSLKNWRLLYRQEGSYVLTLCLPADKQIEVSRIKFN